MTHHQLIRELILLPLSGRPACIACVVSCFCCFSSAAEKQPVSNPDRTVQAKRNKMKLAIADRTI
jgi:hypothetical protein